MVSKIISISVIVTFFIRGQLMAQDPFLVFESRVEFPTLTDQQKACAVKMSEFVWKNWNANRQIVVESDSPSKDGAETRSILMVVIKPGGNRVAVVHNFEKNQGQQRHSIEYYDEIQVVDVENELKSPSRIEVPFKPSYRLKLLAKDGRSTFY